jgi:hypothetical protein
MKKTNFLLILFFASMSLFAQDIITTKSGDDIKAKVLEVNTTEIKYKKIDNIDGPIFSVLKSEVLIVRYENGTKDIFTSSKPINETKSSSLSEDPYMQGKEDAKKFYKGKHSGTGGTVVTAILTSPLLGLIPAIACSSAEPSSDNLNYPNYELMKNNEYNLSYKAEAHSIKKKKVWGGYAIGSGVWLGLILLLSGGGR